MTYPTVRKSSYTGLVVEFHSLKSGIVLDAPESNYWEVGQSHDNWIVVTLPILDFGGLKAH